MAQDVAVPLASAWCEPRNRHEIDNTLAHHADDLEKRRKTESPLILGGGDLRPARSCRSLWRACGCNVQARAGPENGPKMQGFRLWSTRTVSQETGPGGFVVAG